MKLAKATATSIILAALTVCASSPARAEDDTPSDPDAIPTIFLKAKRAQSSGNSTGSSVFSDSKLSTLTIVAEVKCLSKEHVAIALEWYFLAKTMSGDQSWIFDRGSKILKFTPPSMTTREQMTSSELSSYESKISGYKQGSKIEGYIVLVKWNGQVLKADASSKPLLAVANDPVRMKKLLLGKRPRDG